MKHQFSCRSILIIYFSKVDLENAVFDSLFISFYCNLSFNYIIAFSQFNICTCNITIFACIELHINDS